MKRNILTFNCDKPRCHSIIAIWGTTEADCKKLFYKLKIFVMAYCSWTDMEFLTMLEYSNLMYCQVFGPQPRTFWFFKKRPSKKFKGWAYGWPHLSCQRRAYILWAQCHCRFLRRYNHQFTTLSSSFRWQEIFINTSLFGVNVLPLIWLRLSLC
jgi:hypothetical protein